MSGTKVLVVDSDSDSSDSEPLSLDVPVASELDASALAETTPLPYSGGEQAKPNAQIANHLRATSER